MALKVTPRAELSPFLAVLSIVLFIVAATLGWDLWKALYGQQLVFRGHVESVAVLEASGNVSVKKTRGFQIDRNKPMNPAPRTPAYAMHVQLVELPDTVVAYPLSSKESLAVDVGDEVVMQAWGTVIGYRGLGLTLVEGDKEIYSYKENHSSLVYEKFGFGLVALLGALLIEYLRRRIAAKKALSSS